MNSTFGMVLTIVMLSIFPGVSSATSNFECVEKSTGLKAKLTISGTDNQKLRIESENKKIDLNARLDEVEESTYFYVTNKYTIFVSAQLFSKGEGSVSIEEEGEPIDSGSFNCKL